MRRRLARLCDWRATDSSSMAPRPCLASLPRYRRAWVAALVTMAALITGMTRVDAAFASNACSPYVRTTTARRALANLAGTFTAFPTRFSRPRCLSVIRPPTSSTTTCGLCSPWQTLNLSKPVSSRAIGQGGRRAHRSDVCMGEDTPIGGYWSTIGGTASLNTAYNDQIALVGLDEWTVNVGSLSGTALDNPMVADLIRTGTEELSQGATACSEQYNLAYEGDNGIWYSGWGTQPVAYDSPPYAWWVNTGYWVRDESTDSTCYE